MNQQAFALGRLHQNYREFNNGLAPGIGEILDREDGNITQLSYRVTVSQQRILANAAVDYATGDTFYDGHLMSGAPATDTTHNRILALRGEVGYVVWSDEKGLLAPQVEFGYRSWTRHINGTGQEERYSHLLLGVGVRGYYALSENLVAKALVFTGKTINPKIEGTAGLNWDPASLGTAPYRRVGIGLDYGLRDGWHVGAMIDYVTWRYGQSGLFLATYDNGAPAGYFLEPESRTAQTSYLLTIGHEF
ncbi:MAG TPA: hypothetical protein VKA50_01355 [Gammaproteobacteria bacterium]|nr:hypothetical protein [Gammaproteobacteria bacterium]